MCNKKWKIIIPISNDIKEYVMNTSLGLLTGAGGIVISDYRIERRNTFNEFEIL